MNNQYAETRTTMTSAERELRSTGTTTITGPNGVYTLFIDQYNSVEYIALQKNDNDYVDGDISMDIVDKAYAMAGINFTNRAMAGAGPVINVAMDAAVIAGKAIVFGSKAVTLTAMGSAKVLEKTGNFLMKEAVRMDPELLKVRDAFDKIKSVKYVAPTGDYSSNKKYDEHEFNLMNGSVEETIRGNAQNVLIEKFNDSYGSYFMIMTDVTQQITRRRSIPEAIKIAEYWAGFSSTGKMANIGNSVTAAGAELAGAGAQLASEAINGLLDFAARMVAKRNMRR